MATTTNLGKVHVFPSEDSYNTNKGSVGANDLALVPIGAATTSEYGLTRLASEADVLSEAEGAVVHVPLAYKLNDFRRLNTAYKVGDKVNCAFRFEFYLECTQAGTTSANTLDTRNVTFGQTITDGTVKWIVRAHVKSVNNIVPDANGNIAITIPTVPSIASQAEAEAGTNNSKIMTPLRVKQAIDKLDKTTLTNDGVLGKGGIDWNTLIEPGFYHVNASGSTNRPVNIGCKVIVLREKSNDYITQVAFAVQNNDTTIGKIYLRNTTDGGANWTDWVTFAIDSEVVHLTGKETISGDKIFNNLVQSNYGFSTKYKGNTSNISPNFSFEITDYTKGDTPSKYIEARYYLYGYNQNGVAAGALAGMLFGVRANKNTFSELRAFKNQNDVSTFGSIGVEYDAASDSYKTYAPHPASNSKDSSIATTKHVDDVKNALLASNNNWTGANKFVDDNIVLDGANLVITNKDYLQQIYKVTETTKGTLPTNSQELIIRLIDSSGSSSVANTFAEIGIGYTKDGDSFARVIAAKTEAGATERTSIDVKYDLSAARFVTSAPIPPSDAANNEIATVKFVKDRIAEGSVATLKATRTSAGSFTVSGLKVRQPILLSCYLTNNTWDGGDYSAISSDNVSGGSFTFATGASGGRTYTAIAIADATSVTFNVTNHGITSAKWKVYAL